MAKSKHNNLFDTIGDFILNAKKEQLVHLYSEGTFFDGRHIQIQGQKLFHFGTTGYLGLEQDQRLKAAAIDAIQRYGINGGCFRKPIFHSLFIKSWRSACRKFTAARLWLQKTVPSPI